MNFSTRDFYKNMIGNNFHKHNDFLFILYFLALFRLTNIKSTKPVYYIYDFFSEYLNYTTFSMEN